MISIEDKIRIHDQFQFELKFTYPFDRNAPVSEYSVDTYLFVPYNLGVNKITYGKREFYADIQKYIRLKTPVFRLHSINSGADSPLEKLRKAMRELSDEPVSAAKNHNFKYHLKMFCAIFKSAIRDEVLFIRNWDNEKKLKKATAALVNDISLIVSEFRKLEKLIKVSHVSRKQQALYRFADEYVSILIEQRIYKLLAFIKEFGEGKICDRLVKLAASELEHRRSCGYPSVQEKNSSNESVIYRAGILKKIMGNILFLHTSTKKEGRMLEQFSMGFAAGMAMAMATGFIFLSRSTFEEFSLSLFIVLVMIYIFKDRLKEMSKALFCRILRKYLYDYKTFLQTSFGSKVGFCRESFEFVSEDNLPDLVRKIRNKDYIDELDNGYTPENIIYFKKYLRISSEKCKQLVSDFRVDGVNDIVRFNVGHMLNKMDNPYKNLCIPDEENGFKVIDAEVSYHLNLILRYGLNGDADYHKFRIILNRDGIKRIEEVPFDLTRTGTLS
ncbi:hypothetical protein P0136_12140 [Lentisphaerota bacterium ZTH]|nr:hypothetical protein JYG24_10345 [Lentisphaerota bacterium]WET06108.1 hypothetical protein P0136_12140 [Lentisphaerota bacterium ZTH]